MALQSCYNFESSKGAIMRISALVTILGLAAAPAQAAICHTENLMPAFLTFEAKTEGMAPDARADLFVKAIAERNPGYYTGEEFGVIGGGEFDVGAAEAAYRGLGGGEWAA